MLRNNKFIWKKSQNWFAKQFEIKWELSIQTNCSSYLKIMSHEETADFCSSVFIESCMKLNYFQLIPTFTWEHNALPLVCCLVLNYLLWYISENFNRKRQQLTFGRNIDIYVDYKENDLSLLATIYQNKRHLLVALMAKCRWQEEIKEILLFATWVELV